MHVLVVDDERAVREALDRALRTHGYDVSLAEHGLAALASIRADEPDLVLLDVMMPGLDGLGVCRRLRQDEHSVLRVCSTRHRCNCPG